MSNDTKRTFPDIHILTYSRGLNKEELELYTEMKARRDAEDEAKRATESSDEEVVKIMRMMKMLVVIERIIESCFIGFFSRRVRQVRTRRKTRLIQRVAVTQMCDRSVRK